MTQYLLAVHGSDEDYAAIDPETMQQMFEETDRFNDKVREAGIWVFAGGLESPGTATVVDGTGDAPVMTDGPYLETKEHIGGFWIIDVPDLDEALRWAAEGSKACQGKVEVRPFQAEPSEA
ncbi:YciI family protein [Nocardioides bizhenqiangii]|uniref:YciI family protein n=1 Tax=Nocardioides bizhenqiangii TaxID=3095076 RepID=A0ABZ0ZQY0_9ACTN|nr:MULTISPECIES: YciI family protein [unclassified Nocardioides]MDZ5619477.1 YciI family protein [Nocardioides sp. HM23]WQQ26505.1 YciI family protein [Nocardioides sp. HM61]